MFLGGDNINHQEYIKLIQTQSVKLGHYGVNLIYKHKHNYIYFTYDDYGNVLDKIYYKDDMSSIWHSSTAEEYYNWHCVYYRLNEKLKKKSLWDRFIGLFRKR